MKQAKERRKWGKGRVKTIDRKIEKTTEECRVYNKLLSRMHLWLLHRVGDFTNNNYENVDDSVNDVASTYSRI